MACPGSRSSRSSTRSFLPLRLRFSIMYSMPEVKSGARDPTRLLGVLTALALVLTVLAAFFYAPMERTQGNVQRIFYLHLPIIWVAYAAFFVVFVMSGLYLWKQRATYDH